MAPLLFIYYLRGIGREGFTGPVTFAPPVTHNFRTEPQRARAYLAWDATGPVCQTAQNRL